MSSFSLNHLTSEEFEEYCYDLLSLIGFKNLSWRKGTGYSASPSDQGRDIQGHQVRELVGNMTFIESWFFECKHHRAGVPFDKVSGALTSALSECPNFLVLIASNFFSNPTKNKIEAFEENNKPKYQIVLWEKKELEELSLPYPALLNKYRVPSGRGEIELRENLSDWEDKSLAKVMRAVVNIANSSQVSFRGIQDKSEKRFYFDIPVEHLELLKEVLREGSKTKFRDTRVSLDPMHLDLKIQKRHSALPTLNFETLNIKGFTTGTFAPVVIKIAPPSSSNEGNLEGEDN